MYKEQYLAPFLFKRFVCFRRFTQYSCIDSSAGGANLAESENNCWGGRSRSQWQCWTWSAAWWWTWKPRWPWPSTAWKWKISPCRDFQRIPNLNHVQFLDDAIAPKLWNLEHLRRWSLPSSYPHLNYHSTPIIQERATGGNSLNWEI